MRQIDRKNPTEIKIYVPRGGNWRQCFGLALGQQANSWNREVKILSVRKTTPIVGKLLLGLAGQEYTIRFASTFSRDAR